MYKTAMEQNGSQWLGAPSCSRGSFAFYKSVSSRSEAGGPGRVWKLGGFYFVRCGPQEPVCIAEVTLLWEDQAQRHLLASSRLYFLPEDTPRGRTRDHGEDEVIAVSKRIVVRVDDLAKWACTEPPLWRSGRVNGNHQFKTTSSSTDAEQSKENTQGEGVSVRVLSYPQYCRYRSLRKRVEELGGWLRLQDPHLKTLEEIRMVQQNTRVLYCRDIFTHPTLNTNTSILAQLGWPSLRLKGRPRKRRGRYARIPEQSDLPQAEAWMEQMNENVLGSAESQWSGGWPHHPEQQLFLDQLFSFMERRGSPISKVPNLGFKKIDLFLMYSVVKKLGGYENVTNQRLWKTVYNELGGSPGSTSAATCTRRHYEKLMLPYEQFMNNGSKPTPAQLVAPMKPMRGRPPLHLQREKKISLTPPQAVSADGVVKRGRGRPPGRRKAMAARANQGRPPLKPTPPLSQGTLPPPTPPQGPPAPLPPTVPQRPDHSTPLQAQAHTSSSSSSSSSTISTPPLARLLTPEELKLEPPDVVPLTPSISELSQTSSSELVPPVTRLSGVPQVSSSEPVLLSMSKSSSPSPTLSSQSEPTVSRSSGLSQAELAPPASKSLGPSQASSPTAAAAVVVGVGSLGSSASPTVFSPTKGLCPLDLFRTRLGLGAIAAGATLGSAPVHVPPHHSSVGRQGRHPPLPTGGSALTSTTTTPVGPNDPPPPPQQQHQCSGCAALDDRGGVQVEVGSPQSQSQSRSLSPLPPLRILPLELDCSLQVRQLMRSNLSSEHVQSFTKRLSEALAHDLELPRATAGPHAAAPPPLPSLPPSTSSAFNAPHPPPPAVPVTSHSEQVQPLNLSRWGGAKRPAGDDNMDASGQHDDGSQAPVAKQPRLDEDGLPLKPNGGVFRFPLFQDQPADLSLPCRVRALLKENRCIATKSPDRSEPRDCTLRTEATANNTSCRAAVCHGVPVQQGGAVGLGSVLGGAGGGWADASLREEDGGKVPMGVPGTQHKDKGRDAPLANRAQVAQGGHEELSNGKLSAFGDKKMLTNGDLDSEGSHGKLANGELGTRAGLEPDYHMALAYGDPHTHAEIQPLTSCDPDAHDEHMTLANGDPDAHDEHMTLANGDPDAHDEHMTLANGDPDTHEHVTLANGDPDAYDELPTLANSNADAHDKHMALANGDPDINDKHVTLANWDLDTHDQHMALANRDSDPHIKHIELVSGDSDVDEDHIVLATGEPYAEGSFISLVLPESPPHSHCNSITNTLLS
ncbi:hypothetical protein ACEWY4_009425 [Coilia grayii]|uniref:ARID domain-containing protein n=1 Tax=Coilia grayii TaxID=363190 RepID=A0ABD1K6C9_9TELE